MTPEAKQLLKDKPELCKEIVIAFHDSQGYANPHDEHFEESWEYFIGLHTYKKDWEILSFKHPGKNRIYSRKTGSEFSYVSDNRDWIDSDYAEQAIKRGELHIHSVRRLSDNEVFTEKGGVDTSEGIGEIIGFEIRSNQMFARIRITGATYSTSIYNIKKRTPLFTTEDGKAIFTCDDYFIVSLSNYGIIHTTASGMNYYEGDVIRFSTRSAAEQWVEDNKPKYSIAKIKEHLHNKFSEELWQQFLHELKK